MHTLLPHPNLRHTPLQNFELILFVDGSSSHAPDGSLLSGYAICPDFKVVESGKLPNNCSAQQAAVFALA